MLLDKKEFIKQCHEHDIDPEKYVGLNAFQVEELTKADNFIKKEIIKPEHAIKIVELGQEESEVPDPEDTYYYFQEGEYIVVLVDEYTNFEHHKDPMYQDLLGEIKNFMIIKKKGGINGSFAFN